MDSYLSIQALVILHTVKIFFIRVTANAMSG